MLKRLFNRGSTAADPVCAMSVDTGNPPGGKFEYSGTVYYFCGDGCRTAFEKDPSSFLQGADSEDHASSMTHGGSADSDVKPSPTAPISFSASDDPSGEGKFVEVVYQCVCGCRPTARIEAGSGEFGREHCCCGRVHFAGAEPERQLRSYMAERAKTNMDEDVAPYVYAESEATTESGRNIEVAYAQPENPRK